VGVYCGWQDAKREILSNNVHMEGGKMAGIEDFVKMAAQGLGEPESVTRSATGGLLGALQQKADPNDFSKLLGAIPGASGLVGGASKAEPAGGGGGLGGLMGAATSALGGNLGSSLGVLASMQKSGLSMESVTKLVPMFMKFARSNAGDGLVNNLLSKVPELAKLAG
jgi:Protein of unknown function VcgC/VcgE (DUF2780)